MVYRWINIAPLLDGHVEEIAAEIRHLATETVVDAVAFSCTLTPEGTPPFDKSSIYASRFSVIKKALAGEKIGVGILLQATMGHGYTPDSLTEFQKVVCADGKERYIFCPLGEKFRAYLRHAVRTLVQMRPDFIMLDDDTRLISGRGGCFCPLHLAEMTALTGRKFTYDTLLAAIQSDVSIAKTYDQLLATSIVNIARVIREEIDRVDASIPGYFCCCAQDVHHAGIVAKTLAANGQQRVIRLNNGRYLRDTLRDIPAWLHRTAAQIALLPNDAIVLDEPDTCPQNRYSTAALSLHTHITMSLFEGCGGFKLWITRMSDFEPASGEAYRQVLTQNSGMYLEINKLSVKFNGVSIPLSSGEDFSMRGVMPRNCDWGSRGFAFFGIPYVNSRNNGEVTALSVDEAESLPEGELRQILRGRVLLDGGAAMTLSARGFAKLIGVKAVKWEIATPSFEIMNEGGIKVSSRIRAADLRAMEKGAVELSQLYHRDFALSPNAKWIAPGAIEFRNDEGGQIVTMAMILPTELQLADFYFYTESRKAQILKFLRLLLSGKIPGGVYYPGDGEIMVRSGLSTSKERIVVLLDIGLDPFSEIPLAVDRRPCCIWRLQGDGSWRALEFVATSDCLILIKTTLEPLQPATLKFAFHGSERIS